MSNFFGTALTGGSNALPVYDGPVYEGYNVEHGGEFAIAMESAQDQLEIVAALATLDVQTTNFVKESMEAGEEGLQYVAENFEPVLEAAGGNVITKIKEAIKKLWGKVKAFFASVIRSLDAATKSVEDFVKKYQKQIENLKATGLKYKFHNYTFDAALSKIESAYGAGTSKDANDIANLIEKTVQNTHAKDEKDLEAVQTAVEKYREGSDGRLEEFRGNLVGASGKLDGTEFREQLAKLLRGGKDDSDIEEKDVSLPSIIADIKATSKLTSRISKLQKDADKLFAEAIKLVDRLENAVNKAKPDATKNIEAKHDGATVNLSSAVVPKASLVASTISRDISGRQAIVNTAISEVNAAVKERDAVYKKIIIKAFSFKKKD